MWNKILINKIADLGIGCLKVINHCIDLDTLMLSSICVDLALRGLSKHSKHFALVNTTPYVKGIVATNLMAKATAASLQQNGQLTAQFFTGLVGITYLMHNDITDITHVHTQITFKEERTENTHSVKEPSAQPQQCYKAENHEKEAATHTSPIEFSEAIEPIAKTLTIKDMAKIMLAKADEPRSSKDTSLFTPDTGKREHDTDTPNEDHKSSRSGPAAAA